MPKETSASNAVLIEAASILKLFADSWSTLVVPFLQIILRYDSDLKNANFFNILYVTTFFGFLILQKYEFLPLTDIEMLNYGRFMFFNFFSLYLL